MGIFDKVKNFANKNKDKVAQGVDKATDVVDDKTGGKHTDKLEQVDEAARKYAGDSGDAPTDPASPAPSAPTTSTPPPAGPDDAPGDSRT